MRSATPSSGATTMPARSVTTRHDRLHIRGAGPRTLVTRDLPIAITRGRNRLRFITCSARDEGSLRIVGRVFFRKPVLAHLQAISDRTAAFTRATMIEYDDPYRAAYR